MNLVLVGFAISAVTYGILKAIDAAITFYALLVKAQEELE